jgi:hypothetical protein
MSAGFTMVYSSIYDGTLMNKWPAAAVFATLLPLADKNGDIDLNPELIAFKTGWPIQELLKGIEQLMQPDPLSRTKDKEGRRLELIDPERPWGWHVVNHKLYREKGRLAGKNALATESGRDAERKRIARAQAAETPAVAKGAAPTAPPGRDKAVPAHRLAAMRKFLGAPESKHNEYFDSLRSQLPNLTEKQCASVERSAEFKRWQGHERWVSCD